MPQRRGIAGGDYSSRPGAELPELAAAAMSGNEAAFEQIHRRLSGGLIRFFLTRTRGQASVAEELAQTTWVHLWRSLRDRRYDPARSAISTFVYAIGHHVWLQHRREIATGPYATADSERLFFLAGSTEEDPAGVMAAAELLEAVRQAVQSHDVEDGLSEEEQGIVLAVAAGQSERQLAERHGVAASTIHARKTTALGKLRRLLARRGIGLDEPERPSRAGE